jgi:hypothetical protein
MSFIVLLACPARCVDCDTFKCAHQHWADGRQYGTNYELRSLFLTSALFSRTNPQCLHRRVKNGSKPRTEKKKRFEHLGQGQVAICHTKCNQRGRNPMISRPSESAIVIRRASGVPSPPSVASCSGTRMASPTATHSSRIRRRLRWL